MSSPPRIFADPASVPADVRAVSLGSRREGASADPALDRLVEMHVRAAAAALADPARGIARIEPMGVERMRYDAWQRARPGENAIGLHGEDDRRVLLLIEPRLVSALVDRMYGGKGIAAEPAAITPAGDRLATRVGEALARAAGEGERPLRERETHAAFTRFAAADAMVAVLRLAVSLGDAQGGALEFVYPADALDRALRAEGGQAGATDRAGEWTRRLARAARDVSFNARVVLARPEISMGELMALRAGDIIAVTVTRQVPMHVAGRRIATGRMGEANGRAAFMVETTETTETQNSTRTGQ